MTMDERTNVDTGMSTRQGSAAPNADAAVVHCLQDGTVGAAVVDGIGHAPPVAHTAALLAEVAARVTARRGALAGLLSAGELISEPGSWGEAEADAVAVAAVTGPGDSTTRVAWVGDARAWGWNGSRLLQYSTDQTMGEFLRVHGDVPAPIAEHHDAWVRASLATAVVATVHEVEIPDHLVLLTTDGIHDSIDRDVLERLVVRYAKNPRGLAAALCLAAGPDRGGIRDDATAVVILHR
jgi:serine/threonine protein phosphatase PrpC